MRRMAVFIATLSGVMALSASSQAGVPTIYVGMVDGGQPKRVVNWDGACSESNLNNSNASGLIADSWVGGMWGFESYINLVNAPIQVCGHNITPLVMNGHYLDINGGPFQEFIYNFGHDSVYAYGNDGPDRLLSLFGGGFNVVDGGRGDDYLSGSSGTHAYGGEGNDTFCSFPSLAAVDGGSDWDTLCGTSRSRWGIEDYQPGCACGLF